MLLLRKKLYRLMRRVFPSLEYADHDTIRRRLSYVYAFTAWHFFVVTVAMVYYKNTPSGDVDYTNFITASGQGGKTAKVITIGPAGVVKREVSEEELETYRQQRAEILKAQKQQGQKPACPEEMAAS